MHTYDSLQNAYVAGIQKIHKEGGIVDSVEDITSVGSLFGQKQRDYRELQGYGFVLSNPRFRIIDSQFRNASLGFSLANFVWVICGRRDVNSIAFYNKRGRLFSDDGQYYESAFGDRIFGRHKQWNHAKKLLGKDRNTRRALIPLYLPKDLKSLPLDTPCASSLQLMIRENRLDMLLHMRSQSAVMIFPYDLFLFSMIQELFSIFLNLPMGKLIYYCNSFHYYMDEETLAMQILSEHNNHIVKGREMPPMDAISENDIGRICKLEEEIRNNISHGNNIPSGIEDLPEYWKQIMVALWLKGKMEHSNDLNDLSNSISLFPKELI